MECYLWQKKLEYLEEMREWGDDGSNEIVEAKERLRKLVERLCLKRGQY